jgi:hypothetical protein
MLMAMLAVVAVLVLTLAAGVWTLISYVRLCGAVEDVGATTLGVAPTVPSILATRDALRETARDRGFDRAIVFAGIERRTDEAGATVHVAAFELCTRSWHPSVERTLPRLLTADELQTLKRERIGEHTGPGWEHHHHGRR